ncbi:MAG TPA: hypothetical protein VFL91_07010 [Thermomicrobiales bacterium]|nr:hypothetical protein [Thermomicrobiales bacterium]
MIVVLNGRSMLCEGLAAQLGLANHPVVSVPLLTSIKQLSATLVRLAPSILVLDAGDVRDAGFLFLEALRQEPVLAACPVLIIAGGTLPDEERFRAIAAERGFHLMLHAASFEELVAAVEDLAGERVDAPALLAATAD